jgi:hypothetical protein
MSLPTPNYSYRHPVRGAAARMERQDLEGLSRTRAEELRYWEATLAELTLEFPWLDWEIEQAKAKVAALKS